MNITIRDLLDAGLHFGHQLRRYNPKSKKFVFDNRHGISVIDLEKSFQCLDEATRFIENLVAEGGKILLIGTKKQAQEIIREAAIACNMPFAANRWLGGGLTNFTTIKRSTDKYKRYLAMENDGSLAKMHKKESSAIRREMSRMNRNFEGTLDMNELPDALFVVDTKTEYIAVAEANRLKIPVVALVDTNSDSKLIQYPIPGNDDSLKSIRIVVETVLDAIQNGIALRDARLSGPLPGVAAYEDMIPSTEEDAVPESFSTEDVDSAPQE